jgi:hypothetical protein
MDQPSRRHGRRNMRLQRDSSWVRASILSAQSWGYMYVHVRGVPQDSKWADVEASIVPIANEQVAPGKCSFATMTLASTSLVQ